MFAPQRTTLVLDRRVFASIYTNFYRNTPVSVIDCFARGFSVVRSSFIQVDLGFQLFVIFCLLQSFQGSQGRAYLFNSV